jgi:glycosyltransferase involved in cell wall biosynthesis
MENEHFGIAVAEMLRAGCIPFVHDSGGPVEIVGGRGELHFQDAAGGAQALAAAMRDPARQEGLRRSLAERRNLFSAEEFCSTLRRLAGEFSVDPKESVM